MTIDPSTELYVSVAAQPGRFGATVYNALFARYGLNKVYVPRQAPASAAALVAAIRTLDLRGVSVSMPLKSAVVPLLDDVEPIATAAESVNTIVHRDGRLLGFNTDHFGASRVLAAFDPRRVLVYGAGSVAGTVLLAARGAGATDLTVAARRPDRARALARRFDAAAALPEDLSGRYDILINCTPASAERTPDPTLLALVDQAEVLFDLVVAPDDTPLVGYAADRGHRVARGIVMALFLLQRQFEHYCGFQPDLEEIWGIIHGRYGRPA
jgi:shikimate dehydrogenase